MNNENIWEQLEEHIHDNLGYYGLEFLDKFLDLKEGAEDLKLCPPDTPERQDRLFAESRPTTCMSVLVAEQNG